MAKAWTENVDRFREMILYISQKCASEVKFDSLKLAKIMFFSDFLTYAIFGEPITGFEYLKREKGPAPRRLSEFMKNLTDKGELGMQDLPLVSWKRPVNLRSPDLRVFKPEQIAVIDGLIEKCRDFDSDTMSNVSHKLPCWIIPDLHETIPYEAVFFSREEPTDVDIERGIAVAKELGLLCQQNLAQ